ncbi:hypothetical protein POM88_039475 [Heracleum sosnowskyi]|uniref:Uncharacterized protein n=1 Tax=Heracleum sosnowskyi TaxID=360622 RepID=A0AAD8HCR6_9APIA|nr:hypothetical protein POM88_039475 [Heracleum sosnowskyi]
MEWHWKMKSFLSKGFQLKRVVQHQQRNLSTLYPRPMTIKKQVQPEIRYFLWSPTKHVKEICCSTAMSLFDELHVVRISFNNLIEENVRLKATNVMLSEINAMLETQVSEFEETLVDCMNAKHELEAVLKREVVLKEQLRKEQEVITRWNNSS